MRAELVDALIYIDGRPVASLLNDRPTLYEDVMDMLEIASDFDAVVDEKIAELESDLESMIAKKDFVEEQLRSRIDELESQLAQTIELLPED